eukprot:gnl/MRDRNA2_/MRDRNA2_81972_c0_seq3.p1 gnl/MRDRNA2_/MRDRNA2_81972_c0~~gnl/MRDRNA2_/MRDRNA2_81972_c0_seq3.p1  ORF type:complete len:534 (+),score=72.28 gnl/MRDRNA2_/MRDRNA2_81972_c0_seq3:188-1603(+)
MVSTSGNTAKKLPIYRVSNNGRTGGRPNVVDIFVYSDTSCTVAIPVTWLQESGSHQTSHPSSCRPGVTKTKTNHGLRAFDGEAHTSWLPQCHPCEVGVAWVTFSTSEEVKCVQAANLGQGVEGEERWDGGILVETQRSDDSWSTVLLSTSGNAAKSTQRGELTPPSPPSPPLSKPPSVRMQAVLDRHNKYRRMHGVPPMTWSDDIAKNSESWAKKIKGKMSHSTSEFRTNVGGFNYLGENLAHGVHVTGPRAVDLWYDEIKLTRDGVVKEFSKGTGHYTQVVWKTSTSLGCGVYKQLLVCQYGPGGNKAGQFETHVPALVKTTGGEASAPKEMCYEALNKDGMTLAINEGSNTGKMTYTVLDDCKKKCNGDSRCHSFTVCPGDGKKCYFKDRVLASDEALRDGKGRQCQSYRQIPCTSTGSKSSKRSSTKSIFSWGRRRAKPRIDKRIGNAVKKAVPSWIKNIRPLKPMQT